MGRSHGQTPLHYRRETDWIGAGLQNQFKRVRFPSRLQKLGRVESCVEGFCDY